MTQSSEKFTKGTLLTRNALYNLVGQAFPIFAALFSIPILINSLEVESFGILTLAWVVTGYFGLLDLGVGRALTKMLAEKIGLGEYSDVSSLIWTALMLTFFLGLTGGLLLGFFNPIIVDSLFEIPLALRDEAKESFYILAISVPIIIISSALSGVLEAFQRFDLVNIVRVPISSFSFLAPVLVLQYSDELSHIIASLVLMRFIGGIIYFVFCIRAVPNLIGNIGVEYNYVRNILRFGGWMTVSNFISPLIIYLDRFLIGSIVSISAVAFYAAPSEIVNRMMIIPGAIVGVIFPALGTLIGSNPRKAKTLFINGVKYTFLVIFPAVFIIFTFAQEGLAVWLGDEFSKEGSMALKWLILGGFISSLSYFPYAVLHASGRPDITAKVHVIEALIYIFIAWLLIDMYGIEGAAIAWLTRATLDTVILFYLAGKILKVTYPIKKIIFIAVLCIFLFSIQITFPQELYFKIIFVSLTLVISLVLFWKKLLNYGERDFILTFVNGSK